MRRTLISIAVLLVLLVCGATGYVFYSDRTGAKPATSNALTSYKAPSLPKPSSPNPNAAEGAAVDAIDSPVSVGQNTSITIQTNRGSTCTISVTYNGVASKDSGLGPKKADDYGTITWSWTVDKTAAIGTWPVKVTCAYNGRTAFVQGDLQESKPKA